MDQDKLIEEINFLKKRKNAVILAHNYQRPEIFKVADFIGDSLQLCQEAAKTKARLIVFCGVNFMAESAVILNPEKKVVVPYLDAGCTMADMVDAKSLREFKKSHPKAAVVCYVNSSAEVKAECDVCCTSSNAVGVVKAMKEKEIIFVPDKNLAAYVAKQVPDKTIIAWKGYCPIHQNLNKESIESIRKTYPKAKIIAHPECTPEVVSAADYVSSTSGMIKMAKENAANEFFVVTECGMTERMRLEIPDKHFEGLCNICFDMKKNHLEAVLKALESEKPVVIIDKKVLNKARKAFDKMFSLTRK